MREIVDGLGYVPKSCTWELTLACNLRCGHCGSRAGNPRPDELGRPRLLEIANELADLGCRTLTLSGGEPTLSKHWEAVGAEAAGRGIAVNMITNAARADKELPRRAKEAGLVSIAASLDGLEATHDRHRGLPGSFKRVMALIEACHAAGPPVGVVTTLQKRNVRELDAIEELLAGKVYVWQLQLGAAMGNLLEHRSEQLDPKDLLQLIPALAGLVERSPINIRIANNIGYYGKYESTLRRHRSTPVECWVGCFAGCRHLGIQSDGSVKGCLSLQATEETEGSLAEHALADIWHREGAFSYNRSFSTDSLTGFCRTCEHADICRGGCFSMRTCEGGSENPFCYHRVATLDARSLVKSKRRYAPLALAPAALLAAFGIGCAGDKPQGPPPAAPTADPFPGEPPSGEPPSVDKYGIDEPPPGDPPSVAEYAVEAPPDQPPMTTKYGVPPPKE